MIEAVLYATLIVAFISIPIASLVAIAEDVMNPIIGLIIFFVWSVCLISVLIYAAKQENEKGPCLEYQTKMAWNAATKTTMPARVCVERGEWVK